MNTEETARNARIAAMSDFDLVSSLTTDVDVTDTERSAFADMRAYLADVFGEPVRWRKLSERQRAWAEEVKRRVTPIRADEVPRGREVPTPAVLQTLPLRPPGRSSK